MNDSCALPAAKPCFDVQSEGMRPGGDKLLALVDQTDPAFLSIIDALHEMRDAGVDLNESAVRLAVQIGRHRHGGAVESGRRVSDGAESIVYYARRSGLIKIGTTTQPIKRFAALLPDEIPAWEPGGEEVERARHVQFASRHAGGEFFVLHEALHDHMLGLRRLHGEPDPAWPTLATVHRIRSRVGTAVAAPAPSPRRVTVLEGVAELGIRRNTVDVWVRRKVLTSIGLNEAGRPLYLLDHMIRLARSSGLLTEPAA